MTRRHPGTRLSALFLLACLLFLTAGCARAGIAYQFLQSEAAAGAPITLQGILYNDTQSALPASAPHTLTLKWRGADGRTIASRFTLRSPADSIDLPVNNFIKLEWTGQAPLTASGPQSVAIPDSPVLLAMDVTPAMTLTASAHGQPPASATSPEAREAATTPQGSPFENFRNSISAYEPVYLVAGNRDGANARYQLSFKYRLHSPADPSKPGFWDNFYIGYTQTALWDLHSDSIPFVDTTYNPSLFWSKDAIWETPDQKWFVGLNTGVEHRSNGKGGDDSRSINDFYVEPAFNYRLDGGSTLSFMPRAKVYFATDRDMHYEDYQGYVDWKLRWAQDNGLSASALYRLGKSGRHAVELGLAWPLRRTPLDMNGYLYLQYFQGYGETLLGYAEKSSPQIRLGIGFVP